jgi:hypothetical protein
MILKHFTSIYKNYALYIYAGAFNKIFKILFCILYYIGINLSSFIKKFVKKILL